MPRPRAVRDPERKQRILEAAAELFAVRGFHGVNLADIGTAAGIVGSGIYRHFESKAAILVEMFDRVVDLLITDAEAALRSGDNPVATLAALVNGQVRFTIEERRLCQIYLQESRNLPDNDQRRLRWKQRHYIDLWQDVLGAIRPDLGPAERQVLVHATISGMHSVLRFHSPLPDDELARFMESVARHTLGIDALAAAPPGEPAGLPEPADQSAGESAGPGAAPAAS